MDQQLLRVLLIDHEAESRESLTTFLTTHYSYHVDTAESVEQAWRWVTQTEEPYHAVLIDIALPPETADALAAPEPALGLMRRIQARSPRTGFILLRDPEVDYPLNQALDAGAFRYLEKSFPHHEFAILLRHAANHYRYQEVTREQSLLGHVFKAQTHSLGLQDVAEALMPLMLGIQQLHFDRVRMYVLSDDGQYLVGRMHVGMGPDFEDFRIAVRDDVNFQRMLANPRPFICTRPPGESAPYEAVLGKTGVDQWVDAPLIERGERLLGILTVDNKVSRRPILETELEPVGLLARQIASTIAHHRLIVEKTRRAEQLETLRQTTLDITSERDHGELLRTIVERAVLLLKAQGGGLYNFHPAQELLTLVADHNRPYLEGRELRVGEGVVGKLVEEDEPFKIIENYPQWEHRVWPDRPHTWGCILAVPLKWHGQITGVLFVGDQAERKFREDDIQLLRMFADQAAISLVNMELAEQNAAKMKRLEQAAQATRMITDKLDEVPLDKRLMWVAQYGVDILGAEAALVFLQQASGELRLAARYRCDQVEVKPSQFSALESCSGAKLMQQLMATEPVFNSCGEALQRHPIFAEMPLDHLPSGQRHALLVVPLKHSEQGSETLLGCLVAENKRGWDDQAHPGIGFTAEDEWIATIFADSTVTAMKNAKLLNELVTQRERWQRLVTSAPHGIVALDQHGVVTEHNPQADHILGYASRDVFPSHVTDLYADSGESRVVGDHLSRSPSGLLTHYMTDLRSKTGERIPVRLSAMLLYDDQKRVVGSVGYFEDLRAREEVERQRDLLLHVIKTVIHPENPLEGLQQLTDLLVQLRGRNFCRILLMDEGGMGLTVKAASASLYLGAPLQWKPSLDQTALHRHWPGLKELLDGEPTVLRINDPRYEGGLRRFSKELELPRDVQSLLMVPLKRNEEVVGLLQLGDLRTSLDRLFTTDEIRLVSMIAAQCTVAIQTIRFYERDQVARQRLRSLLTSSNELVSAHAPREVLSNVLKHIRGASGATWLRVLLIDDSGQAWHQMNEGTAHPPALEGAVRPDGISRTVMQTGQAIAIEDTHKKEPWELNPILRNSDIQAALCLPFSGHGKCIGVMWLNYDEPRTFTPAEIEDIQLYVNQAAIAHENAYRLELLQQVRQATAELAEATTLEALLSRITWRARGVFQADSAAIFTYDVDKKHFELCHIADSHARIRLEGRARAEQSPWHRVVETIEQQQWIGTPHVGVTAWPDVSVRYAFSQLGIQSWQASLLRVGRERLGILFVHYLQLRHFDESDREIMTMFADHAAVAWMDMTSAAWRHAIGLNATTIQDRIKLLRADLTASRSMVALEEHLGEIDQLATSIRETPITAPLQPGGGESFNVNEILRDRVQQLKEGRQGFEFVESLDTERPLLVCASAHWFKQALDILIDNALEAMYDTPQKKLTVATRLVDDKVEIVVDDMGKGLSAEVLDLLLNERIPKQRDSKGSGVGLLLARTIIQTYGGDIRLERTSPNGTTMIMWLPLEDEAFIHSDTIASPQQTQTVSNHEPALSISNTWSWPTTPRHEAWQQQAFFPFLQRMSHTFSSTLPGVDRMVQNLASGVVNNERALRDYVPQIVTSHGRLMRYGQQFVNLVDLHANRTPYYETVDLCAVVDDTITRIKARSQSPRVPITMTAPETCPIVIDVDLTNLAIEALLDNAIRFSPNDGGIDVELQADDREKKLVIRDEGPGIPSAQLPHIFEGFYQGDLASGSPSEGFGLGLALVDRIMYLHGGRIEVLNPTEGGAQFTMVFPNQQEAHA